MCRPFFMSQFYELSDGYGGERTSFAPSRRLSVHVNVNVPEDGRDLSMRIVCRVTVGERGGCSDSRAISRVRSHSRLRARLRWDGEIEFLDHATPDVMRGRSALFLATDNCFTSTFTSEPQGSECYFNAVLICRARLERNVAMNATNTSPTGPVASSSSFFILPSMRASRCDETALASS